MMNNASPKQNARPEIFRILIVNIGDHYFGAFIDTIQDVIQRNPTTPVPLASENIVGLLNLRGHIVTEIDVARTLGIDDSRIEPDQGYSIVINRSGEMYSLVFEGVGDVVDVSEEEIERLPDTVSRQWLSVSRGVYRLAGRLVVLLDFNQMIEHLTPETQSLV